MLAEDELRDAVLLIFANKQVSGNGVGAFIPPVHLSPSSACIGAHDWL